MRRTRAFTLIELLIVVAIIAILAAVLFPVFARARDAARRTACLAHEKQIVMASLMYCQDYDECLPVPSYGFWKACCWGSIRWRDTVYPYSKNAQVWWCPSDTVRPNSMAPDGRVCETSYDWSDCLMTVANTVRGPGVPIIGHSLAEVTYPSQKILFWEGLRNHLDRNGKWWGNLGFVDGHAKFLGQDSIVPSFYGGIDFNWTKDGVAGKDIN
jgi:prepilin-type N-terminal cleavage/methylation domain-containing protein/prepilin-type processing-associated H-X9-DG protein